MVLWEITLATAYFLGLKKTYRIALKIQKRILKRSPSAREFIKGRTRVIFKVALGAVQGIQRRDIYIGKNWGNAILRFLNKMKPSANIRPNPPCITPSNSQPSSSSKPSNNPTTSTSTPSTSSLSSPSLKPILTATSQDDSTKLSKNEKMTIAENFNQVDPIPSSNTSFFHLSRSFNPLQIFNKLSKTKSSQSNSKSPFSSSSIPYHLSEIATKSNTHYDFNCKNLIRNSSNAILSYSKYYLENTITNIYYTSSNNTLSHPSLRLSNVQNSKIDIRAIRISMNQGIFRKDIAQLMIS